MNRRAFLLALPVAAAAAKMLPAEEPTVSDYVWDSPGARNVWLSGVHRVNVLSFGAAVEPHTKGPDGYLIRRAR